MSEQRHNDVAACEQTVLCLRRPNERYSSVQHCLKDVTDKSFQFLRRIDCRQVVRAEDGHQLAEQIDALAGVGGCHDFSAILHDILGYLFSAAANTCFKQSPAKTGKPHDVALVMHQCRDRCVPNHVVDKQQCVITDQHKHLRFRLACFPGGKFHDGRQLQCAFDDVLQCFQVQVFCRRVLVEKHVQVKFSGLAAVVQNLQSLVDEKPPEKISGDVYLQIFALVKCSREADEDITHDIFPAAENHRRCRNPVLIPPIRVAVLQRQ